MPVKARRIRRKEVDDEICTKCKNAPAKSQKSGPELQNDG
jgi:hypothetical protein